LTLKNRRMVEEYLKLASWDIEDARTDLHRKRNSRAMGHVASSVEYSAKAALYAVGIEPDKEHRVALHKHRGLFPKGDRPWVAIWDDASARTDEFVVRGRYGSKEGDQLPSELFRDPRPVENELRAAEEVHRQVSELVRRLSR
jgi:HEPN domain-containing protein